MYDSDQVHLNEPAETDGHWTKLGSIYPFKREPPLPLQPVIPIWEPGPKVTISSDFSSESEFLYTISQFFKVDNMFFLIIIMWGRPNKIHLRVKWSCSWATGLQPLYFWFIGNIILNVISPPSLGSMRDYAKFFFLFSLNLQSLKSFRGQHCGVKAESPWSALLLDKKCLIFSIFLSDYLQCMCTFMHAAAVLCSVMSDSAAPWIVACRAPLSMRFPRQEYWSGLPFPSIVFMHTCLKIIISSELRLNMRIISEVL